MVCAVITPFHSVYEACTTRGAGALTIAENVATHDYGYLIVIPDFLPNCVEAAVATLRRSIGDKKTKILCLSRSPKQCKLQVSVNALQQILRRTFR